MKYSAATEPSRGATVEEVRARRVGNPAIRLVRYYDMLRNRAANLFIPILFGLSYNDVTNAFKAYRRPPGVVFATWPTDGGSTR